MPVAAQSAPIVRVLIVDFGAVVRAGLAAILAQDRSIEVRGLAAGLEQALGQLRKARLARRPIDVLLTETRTAVLDGVELTRQVKAEFPAVAVLVLTAHVDDTHVIAAIQAGAGGYLLLNETAPAALLQSIHAIVHGDTQMSAALLRAAIDRLLQNGGRTRARRLTEAAHLSEQEAQVLGLLGNAETNQAIGAALGITLGMVKKHVHSLVAKLHVNSRTHAAILGAQAGFVSRPPAQLLPPVVPCLAPTSP